ncbi:hypothetical protein SAMN05444392_101315 [Seinonella peptonophila]|uniref:Uncharacterized protein n=1 Tax=Seinonella peptonophila TaxID=112248 RepID=A0A1M4T5J6_9BACL|nr:hypothetical protein [Seinonella peptonophila]SHE39660.1 hypothetical protein SAMN05444392_101315 [Seinonella peptonophila]
MKKPEHHSKYWKMSEQVNADHSTQNQKIFVHISVGKYLRAFKNQPDKIDETLQKASNNLDQLAANGLIDESTATHIKSFLHKKSIERKSANNR